jgi:HEAT repeat protein
LKKLVADLGSGEMHRVMPAMTQLMMKKPKEPSRAVASALEKILTEGDNVGMRIQAAHALVNWGTKESLPALKGALKDSSQILKKYAKEAIEAIESRSGS